MANKNQQSADFLKKYKANQGSGNTNKSLNPAKTTNKPASTTPATGATANQKTSNMLQGNIDAWRKNAVSGKKTTGNTKQEQLLGEVVDYLKSGEYDPNKNAEYTRAVAKIGTTYKGMYDAGSLNKLSKALTQKDKSVQDIGGSEVYKAVQDLDSYGSYVQELQKQADEAQKNRGRAWWQNAGNILANAGNALSGNTFMPADTNIYAGAKAKAEEAQKAYEAAQGVYNQAKSLDLQSKYGGYSYSYLKREAEKYPEGSFERQWIEDTAQSKKTVGNYKTEIRDIDAQIAELQRTNHYAYEDYNSQTGETYQSGGVNDRKIIELKLQKNALMGELSAAQGKIEDEKTKKLSDFKSLSEVPEDYYASIFNADSNYNYINDVKYKNGKSYRDSFGSNILTVGAQGASKIENWTLYDQMTDEEKQLYNYYYNNGDGKHKPGKESGDAYLDRIRWDLSQREANKEAEAFQEFTRKHYGLANTLEIPMSLASGAGYVDVAGQYLQNALTGDYNRINYNTPGARLAKNASTIKSTTTQDIIDATGVIDLDEAEHPILAPILNGKSLGDVYQLGMSTAESMAAGGLSMLTGIPNLNSVLLGGSAATQAMFDALERGATDEQALAIGGLDGIMEGFWEKYSWQQLIKNGPHPGLQALTEGTEEFNTSLADDFIERMILGENSSFRKAVEKYKEQGEEKPELKAWKDLGIQLLWDFVGGTAMGAFSDVAYNSIGNASRALTDNRAYKGNASEIVNTGDAWRAMQESAGLNDSAETADNVLEYLSGKKTADTEETLSGAVDALRSKIEAGEKVTNKDVRTVQEHIDKASRQVVENAIKESLSGTGNEQRASQIADAIFERKGISARKGTAWIGQNEGLNKAYRAGMNSYADMLELADQAAKLTQQNEEAAKNGNKENAFNAEQRANALRSGADVLRSTKNLDRNAPIASNGDRLSNVTGIKVDGDTVNATLSTGETVKLDDLDIIERPGTSDEASFGYQIKRLVKSYGEASQAVYQGFLNSGMTLSAYLDVADRITTIAKSSSLGYAEGIKALRNSKLVQGLSNLQQEHLWSIGKGLVVEQKAATKKSSYRDVDVSTEDIEIGGETFKGASDMEAGYKDLATKISKASKGNLSFHFYHGGEGNSTNGFYQSGVVYINVDAVRDGKSLVSYTMSHELTHFIQEYNADAYKKLKDFVVKKLTKKKGKTLNALVLEKQARDKGISYEDALDEVVADGCEMMLQNSNILEELAVQDQSLAQTVISHAKAFLKRVTSGLNPIHDEAKELMKYADQLQKMWDKALAEAITSEEKTNLVNSKEGISKFSIQEGMSDAERYEELKDKSILLAKPNLKALPSETLNNFNGIIGRIRNKTIRDLAKVLGILNVDYNNSKIDFPFSLSGNSIDKSTQLQFKYGGTFGDYVKALTCINDLIKNAELIETHSDYKKGTKKENTDLKQVYVLISAFKDGTEIVPVEFEVKEYNKNKAGIYVVVTLTKINSEVIEVPPATENSTGVASLVSDVISLTDLFANVNPVDKEFLKYVPDGFLSEDQKAAKRGALEEREKLYGEEGELRKSVADVEDIGEADTVVYDEDGEVAVYTDEDENIQFSRASWDEIGRDKLYDFLDKQIEAGELKKSEAKKIKKEMETLYDILKEFEDSDEFTTYSQWSKATIKTDDNGVPILSVITPNGEYKMNIDYSLVCKKRRTLDAVYNKLVELGAADDVFANTKDASSKQIVTINNLIRREGFETACALCFVDAKRFRVINVADQFVNIWNRTVNSLSKDPIAYHNFGGDKTLPDIKNGIDTYDDSQLDFSYIEKVLAKEANRESHTVPYKVAQYIKENPSERKLLSRGDFISSNGFGTVQLASPGILKLYNQKKGSGGPKASFFDKVYANDIIDSSAFKAKAAYEVGGVRLQSFSDYVAHLVFDYLQAFSELSAKKLPAHAYTKEALFALQFGKTGMKINMSLVPNVKANGVAVGLDADGNYAWAGESFANEWVRDNEKFLTELGYGDILYDENGKRRKMSNLGFELAKKIQRAEGYTDNVGTIAVGVSDEHILKMLRDPDIRMVIPYHKSGLNPVVAKMNNISAFHDYTNEQNTRAYKDGKWSKVNTEPFNWNKWLYENPSKTAKDAANEYLRICDERGLKPRFDQFRNEENYYKLLEDFTEYNEQGEYVAQGAVQMNFPTADDAFGDMKSLVKLGLTEDESLNKRQNDKVEKIAKEIMSVSETKEWIKGEYNFGEKARYSKQDADLINEVRNIKVEGAKDYHKTVGVGFSEKLAKKGRAEIIGHTITNAKELAEIAQVYRDPRFETLRWFFTDKDGKVVFQTGVTASTPGTTPMTDAKTRSGDFDYLFSLMEAATARGATGVYLEHNHPGGDPTPSADDIRSTKIIVKFIKDFTSMTPGSELAFKGHAVINTARYAAIDENGSYKFGDLSAEAVERNINSMKPDVPHPVLGTTVNSYEKLAEAAKSVQVNRHLSTVLYADSSTFEIKGIEEFNNMYENLRRLIDNGKKRFGAERTFIATTDQEVFDKTEALIKEGRVTDVVILSEGGEARSSDNVDISRLDPTFYNPDGSYKNGVKRIGSMQFSRADVTDDELTEALADEDYERAERVANNDAALSRKALKHDLLNRFSIPEGLRDKLGKKIDSFADDILRDGVVNEKTKEDLYNDLYDAGIIKMPAEETAILAAEQMKGSRLYVPDSVKAEFSGDYNRIRGKLMGYKVYLTADARDIGVDTLNAEMAEQFPHLFDATSSDEKEILENILDIFENQAKDKEYTLDEYAEMMRKTEGLDIESQQESLERGFDYAVQAFSEKAELEFTLRNRLAGKLTREGEAKLQQRIQDLKAQRKDLKQAEEDLEKKVRAVQRERDRAQEQVLFYRNQLSVNKNFKKAKPEDVNRFTRNLLESDLWWPVRTQARDIYADMNAIASNLMNGKTDIYDAAYNIAAKCINSAIDVYGKDGRQDDYISALTSEIISGLFDADVRQEYTYAERMQNRLERAKADNKELKAKYQALKKQQAERRKASKYKQQILKLYDTANKMLTSPKKSITGHAAMDLMRAVAEMCQYIGTAQDKFYTNKYEALDKLIDERGSTETRVNRERHLKKTIQQLSELQFRYNQVKNDPMYNYEYDESVNEMLNTLKDTLSGNTLDDLESDKLREIYDAMSALMKTVTEANKLTALNTEKTVLEFAKEAGADIDKAQAIKNGILRDYMNKQKSPDVMFNYFGGYKKGSSFNKMQQMFVDSMRRYLEVKKQFQEIFDESITNNKEFKQMMYEPTKHLVDWGLKDQDGNAVATSRGMMLAAYKLLLQEDSFNAIAKAGFQIPKIEAFYKDDMARAFGGGDDAKFYSQNRAQDLYAIVDRLQEIDTQEEDLKADKANISSEEYNKQLNSIESQKRQQLRRWGNIFEEECAKLEELKSNIEDQLTDFEKEFLAKADQWYTHSDDLRNEVNLALYGFVKPGVKNYTPIHRDLAEVQMDIRTDNTDAPANLENAGFNKERVKARAPIQLTDINFDLLHSSEGIARFYGFTEAQRTFNKIYNAKVLGSGKDRNGQDITVKSKIGNKFGTGNRKWLVTGNQYIENYIRSIAGSNYSRENKFGKVYGHVARANLTLNLRVAVSQLASIPTAAAVLGWDNVLRGMGQGIGYAFSTKQKDQLAEKSIYFWQRYKGDGGMPEYSDASRGAGVVDKLYNRLQNTKVGHALLDWCKIMDCAATSMMYPMAEAYVDQHFGDLEGEAREAKIVEIYEETLRKSQPNYTETERSDLLRDKTMAMKIFTMFKTQSNQNLNLLINANGELRRVIRDKANGNATQAEVQEAKRNFANSFTAVVLGGSLAFAVLRMMSNFILGTLSGYRDDDDELTEESVLKGLGKEVLSSLAGNFMGGSQVFDFVWARVNHESYYGISDNAMGAISDLFDSAFKLQVKPDEGSEEPWANVISSWSKFALEVCDFAGIPISNAKKIEEAGEMWANDLKNGTFGKFEGNVQRTDAQNYNIIIKRFLNEDYAGSQEMYDSMFTSWGEKQDVEAGMKRSIKDKFIDGHITEDDAMSLLLSYVMDDENDAADLITEWHGVIDTGYTYNDIQEAYMEGSATANDLRNYMSTYKFMEKDAIDKKINELDFETENGFAPSKLKDAFVEGEITAQEAARYYHEVYGKDLDDAKVRVSEWQAYKDTGIEYSEIEDAYYDGKITYNQVVNMLKKYGDKSNSEYSNDEQAVRYANKWRFNKENPKYAGELDVNQVSRWYSEYKGKVKIDKFMMYLDFIGNGYHGDAPSQAEILEWMPSHLTYEEALALWTYKGWSTSNKNMKKLTNAYGK